MKAAAGVAAVCGLSIMRGLAVIDSGDPVRGAGGVWLPVVYMENSCSGPVTSKFKCWPTARAMPFISEIEIVRFSVAIKR